MVKSTKYIRLQMKTISVYSSTEPGSLYSNVAHFETRVHKKPVIFKI